MFKFLRSLLFFLFVFFQLFLFSSLSLAGDFYYIMAGDPQWNRTAYVDDRDAEKKRKKTDPSVKVRSVQDKAERNKQATETNENHVASINTLAKKNDVRGVILNGDLTEYGHPNERDEYKRIWKDLTPKLYPGLGNHDYSNNVDDCWRNECAILMVEYLYKKIKEFNSLSFDVSRSDDRYEFPKIFIDYAGSLAYSWNEGKIHFVQLNNYPTYKMKSEGYWAGDKTLEIKSSLDWLDKDLARARNEGRAIILNFHDADNHFFKESTANEKTRLKNMLEKYGVSAVFVGHKHKRLGKMTPLNGMKELVYGDVPVFYSGSAIRCTYLLTRFIDDREMRVMKVSSAGGKPTYIEKDSQGQPIFETVMLNTETPTTPHVPDPAKGSITFFNQGGYVAKFSLSYTSPSEYDDSTLMFGGDCDRTSKPKKYPKMIQCYTGRMNLGNKRKYNLPADATSIHVTGKEDTGWVFQKGGVWKKIFDKTSVPHPRENLCYKVYGTTQFPAYKKSKNCN